MEILQVPGAGMCRIGPGSIQRIRPRLESGPGNRGREEPVCRAGSPTSTLLGLTAEQVFNETLATLFNAPGGGQLYVENLKGATGEIALRLGAENEPFGVINVGDDAKLVKLCEEAGLATGDREFSGSLFHEINKPHSTVNLLIGSKKFTEGWSSWRVSTMGLMNVGKGEGAQIIQLFGRGVRLKGYGLSLKRSGKAQLPEDVNGRSTSACWRRSASSASAPTTWRSSATSSRKKDCPTNDDRIEFLLPVIKNLGTQKLRMIRLKKTINGVSTEFGDAFRKLGPVPTVQPSPPEYSLAEEPGRAQLVPEDPGDEVRRPGGRRCGGHAQSDAPDTAACRLPRLSTGCTSSWSGSRPSAAGTT